jgi:hypothetical protein
MARADNPTVRHFPVLRGRGSTAIATGRLALGALAVTGVVLLAATACGDGTTREQLSNTPASPGPPPATLSSSTLVTRDPAAIVASLDAVGLALCHSDYSDLAEYNIYGLFGAVSTQRYFPHHMAMIIHSGNVEALSCVTPSQPDTGAIEIDVYPTPADASAAVRRVGQIWQTGWLYGNVAVLVDKTVPPPQSQQVGDVLDHLSGAVALQL